MPSSEFPGAYAWLEPGFITTDYAADASFAVWVQWSSPLSEEELASLTAVALVDQDGNAVELVRWRASGDALDETTGTATLMFSSAAPLAVGWYAFGARLRGRLGADLGSGRADGAVRDRFSYVHVGSAPVVAQVRYCRGRGDDELYVDFSERVRTSSTVRTVRVERTDGATCALSADDAEIADESLATLAYRCPAWSLDRSGDLRVEIVDGIVGVTGIDLNTGAVEPVEFANEALRDVPAIGCISVAGRISANVFRPVSLDGLVD